MCPGSRRIDGDASKNGEVHIIVVPSALAGHIYLLGLSGRLKMSMRWAMWISVDPGVGVLMA